MWASLFIPNRSRRQSSSSTCFPSLSSTPLIAVFVVVRLVGRRVPICFVLVTNERDICRTGRVSGSAERLEHFIITVRFTLNVNWSCSPGAVLFHRFPSIIIQGLYDFFQGSPMKIAPSASSCSRGCGDRQRLANDRLYCLSNLEIAPHPPTQLSKGDISKRIHPR